MIFLTWCKCTCTLFTSSRNPVPLTAVTSTAELTEQSSVVFQATSNRLFAVKDTNAAKPL